MKNIYIHKDNKISFVDIPKHYACVLDGKVTVIDERWITINADEEEGRKGQHVLIKENGAILAGLGGKFKNLSELGKRVKITRNYDSNIAKGIGKEHYDKIIDLIEKCPDENIKKLWQAKESEIAVENAHIMGGAFCRGRSININIENDAIEDPFNKPYETTIHECSHAIDASTFTERGLRLSTGYKNGLFGQTIKDEIEEAISKFDKEARNRFKQNGTDIEWLRQNSFITYDEYRKIKNGLAKPPSRYSKIMAYREFWKSVNDNEKFEDTMSLRDIVGGVTKNKIGSGHSTAYWNKMERIWGKNGGVAIEAFAEFTSSTLTNPGSLKVIKKYLPRSYKIYQEMIEEAVKERKR